MLNDASGFQKIYLATGYTDLRRGMEGLANIIRFRFHLDPYDRNTLFLFCGKRTYRIKGLLLEEDGFLLLYKRLDTGAFNWSRSKEEALAITPEQYAMLIRKVVRFMSDASIYAFLSMEQAIADAGLSPEAYQRHCG